MINNKINSRKNYGLYTFLTGMAIPFLFMLPVVLMGRGIFVYFGDYNAQQIPFYVHCHEIIRNGFPLWDFGTELGANFLSSYSYYTVASPFFWLTLPFPTSWVPYLMAPLLSLKFGLAALTAYLYIRTLAKTDKGAYIGGLLYALSGWSIYNIFYNQFHESLIVFPLIMLALDKLVKENKKGLFALVVALGAIVNYYFFFGIVIFVIIYFIVRTASHLWEMTWKKFFNIAFESIIGVGISLFILLPTAVCVFGMSRVNGEIIRGWDLLLYNREIYPCIIQSLFFPPELPAIQSFNSVKSVAWQSLSLYLPFVGAIGVFAYIRRNKKDWISRLLIVSGIFMLFPGLNALFTLLQPIYYARWFMMPILFMAIATVRVIENYNADACKKDYKFVSVFTLCYILVTLLLPNKVDGKWVLGIFNRDVNNGILLCICWSFIAIAQLLRIFTIFNKHKKERIYVFTKKIVADILFFAMLVGCVHMFIGYGTGGMFNYQKVKGDVAEVVEYVNKDKDKFRISVLSSDYNVFLDSGLMCKDCFHSVVPGSSGDTYKSVLDFERDVVAPITVEKEYFNDLTSVKYIIVDKDFIEISEDYLATGKGYNNKIIKENYEKYGYALSPNNEIIKDFGRYVLCKNKKYVPFGICYKYYITQNEYNELDESEKEKCVLNALIIKENNVKNYDGVLQHYTGSPLAVTYETKNMTFSNNKMKLSVTCEEDCVIMISVPYEKRGWTACVNGREVDIYAVDGGFMGLKLKSGINEIEFKYVTPFLREGIVISAFSVVTLILYTFFSYKRKRKV